MVLAGWVDRPKNETKKMRRLPLPFHNCQWRNLYPPTTDGIIISISIRRNANKGKTMSEEKQLTIIEQHEVRFYDDEILVVRADDGTVYVPVRPICERLGIDWSGQRQRIMRDAVLSKYFVGVTPTKSGRGNPNMKALPLEYLNGWLFGINASRVNEDVRGQVIRYQEDCYKVLYEALGRNLVTAAPDPRIDELLAGDDPTAIAYRQALAIVNMAREQIIIKARLESAESNLANHENRIQILEANHGDDSRYITNSQAVQIAQGVKQIAMVLSRNSGQNAFGGVYGELHRRFEIPSYQQLPKAKFDEAMHFLRDWWQALTDSESIPF